MITSILLALSYWILGVLFALAGFCALGCLIGLFLSVLYSFKSSACLLRAPLLAVFSFASLGACWLMQWIYVTMGNRTGHEMQYWFLVGAIIPGILGLGFVPKLMGLATRANKNAVPSGQNAAAKV
jgi:hypothetical protein